MIRIGIDVGGTNTDAVIMDGSTVLDGVKAPTTAAATCIGGGTGAGATRTAIARATHTTGTGG